MKKILLTMLGLLLATTGYATTKTVGQSGADFTSIQAAIDSFTTAELTDGEPDVVEIIDDAEYDEQVVIGGLPPIDEASPGFLDEINAQDRDSFTLKGSDPNSRPKINPVSGPAVPYGVFNQDTGDNFIATLSYYGKNITVENVEILQSSIIDGDQYGMNGQAGNSVFNNVLFAHSGDVTPGEALINFNNAVDAAGIGVDNTYTFRNCEFDGAIGGERGNVDAIYFHGYKEDDAIAAGVNIDEVPFSSSFEDCKFLNCDTATYIRGRDQSNHVTVRRCYIAGNLHGLRASGKGTFLVESSIFHNNLTQPEDFGEGAGPLETAGRSGFTPELTVTNSLFVDNLNAPDYEGTFGFTSSPAAIRIRNDGNDSVVTINGNTFVNNPIAIRFVDANGREREAVINSNIFQGSNVAVLTADDAGGSYFESPDATDDGLVQNLSVTGVGNIFDSNNVVVEEQDKLPNVDLGGADASVTFSNTTIDPNDPFAGPPYVVQSGADPDVGADLGEQPSTVGNYMLYQ